VNAPSYDKKLTQAKRWLGDRYLLARPINQKPAAISRENIKACIAALQRQAMAPV
jgi:hypothetical protein